MLALLCFGKVMLIDHLLLKTDGVDFMVALVIAMTMAVTVVCAKMVGCTLPMLAKKLGFDPAVMASPFITTIVDALSLLVYFGIASALLPALREAAAVPADATSIVKQITDHLALAARSMH